MSQENMEIEETGQVEQSTLNPFPGLRPFRIEESHLFFGREGQSDEVLLKLSKNRFIGIIGPSGSGKSSFVYCGVLPILYGGFLTEVSSDWEVVVTRPGAGPIDNVAESLLKTDREYQEASIDEKKVKKTIISTLLRSSSLGLVEAVQQLKKTTKKNYLILVDQFEELFRFKDSREITAIDETLAFINMLLEAVNNQETAIYVALTMRSDFIGECAQFADLTKKINDSHYLIPQLTREQKRKAIEGPVAVGGAEIAPRMVQRLLNDLGDNPDQLPILQHSLMRTWDYWTKYRDRDDEPVDIKHYEAIGTMSEALSLHANEAYDELNDQQKLICESLFKAITEKRGENFGIRRPTRLGEIAAISGASVEEVSAVIEKFREPGRSLLTPSAGIPLTAKSVVDISHESLMRIWVRLKNWVDDEAEAVQMYMRLSEAAGMYQLGKAGLWRPPDLQLALNWEAKHRPSLIWAQRYHPAFERTMEFLAHSKREFETEQRIKELQAKRRLKTARITAMVMAGLCVVAIGFLLYAFDQKTEADRNAELAEKNADSAARARLQAEIEADSAEAARKRADAARELALLAEQAARDSAEVAKIQRDSAAKARLAAEQNMLLAIKNGNEAILNADEARRQQDAAIKAAAEAREAERIATESQYTNLAKAIALRSIDMDGKAFENTKALLAQQAYIFNTKYNGYEYETDVYNGLYFALKYYDNDLTKTVKDAYINNGNIFLETSTKNNVTYSVHANGKILAWNANGLNRSQTVVMEKLSEVTVNAVSLSPDNTKMVLAGTYNARGYGVIVDLQNADKRTEIANLGAGVVDVTYAPNGSIFLLDDNGSTIKQYSNGSIKDVAKSTLKLTSLTISPKGDLLYTATDNGKLLQWNTSGFKMDSIYSGQQRITSVAVSNDGKTLVFGDIQGIMYMWNGKEFSNIPSHKAGVTSIIFSLDGKFMATSSLDKTVRLWNFDKMNKEAIELKDHNDVVSSIAFTTDNNQIMASTRTRSVKFWPISIGQMSGILCSEVTRNLYDDEWRRYVSGVPYEKTCPDIVEPSSQQQ